MLLYLLIIFISAIIISVFNILFGLSLLNCSWWVVIVICVGGIVYEFLVDLIVAIIIKKTPNKWYSSDKKIFNVPNWYKHFAESLKVKKWKDKILELGSYGGFSKRKIENPKELDYVNTFLTEINKVIITHYVILPVGFTLLFVLPARFILTVLLPIALVNAFLNVLPIIVLKYNYPKLKTLKEFLTRQKNKTQF